MALAEDSLKAEPARATPDRTVLSEMVTSFVPQCVLLVEDNIFVALDTEEHLLSLGVVAVNLAGSSVAALASLEANIPDFAVLDFNLGEETSEPIADALENCGVPFVFATGYSEVDAVIAKYPHSLGVLQKPYSREDLARILARPIRA